MLRLGPMTFITTQSELDTYVKTIRGARVIFLDTEFMRERTYYAQLCVVQAKIPGHDPVAIDALSDDLELMPFWDAIMDPAMIKVFHSGKQDLEIIYQATGTVPTPLFDTQIAASVLGHGEQAGFETLAREILHHQLDKGSQFTDWARRPLTDRQLTYALGDVLYLEPIYDALVSELAAKGRESWVVDEMRAISSPDTYRVDEFEVWRRVKMKSDRPRDLAVLRSVAAWREREAQARDIPRGRIIKDEPLGEIAQHHPRTIDELMAIRGIDKGMVKGRLGPLLLDAIADGLAVPDAECPRFPKRKPIHDEQELLIDILKLMVKMRARELGVATRMLASTDEIDDLVRNGFDTSVMARGWRYDAMGRDLVEKREFAFEMDVKGQRVRLKV